MRSERRTNSRIPWNLTGSITVERGIPSSCTVSDLSNSGAKLHCPDAASLPDEFLLHLAPGGTLVPRACRVVWRSANDVGVEFTSSHA
jgi:hypothetical protein